MTGLCREATSAAMNNTLRTWGRPPKMVRLPRIVPESRLIGATPTRALTSRPFNSPSSGTSARSVRIVDTRAGCATALAKWRAQAVERRIRTLGVAVLRLDPALPEASGLALADRDPFPGSPGYAVEYTRADDALPAWPRLHAGFHGMPEGSGTPRRLGIEIPPGLRGGPVLDAAGRLAGIALPHADGADRVLMASLMRPDLGALFDAPTNVAHGPAQRAPVGEVYERALRLTLQLIALR